MPHCFQYHTHVTALDVGLNVVLKRWPVVFSSRQLAGLFDAKIAR